MKFNPWQLVVSAVLTFGLARYVFIPIGERVAGISDSVFWQILPWLLLAAIWMVLIHRMRRARRGL